jgi:hypothetical protein
MAEPFRYTAGLIGWTLGRQERRSEMDPRAMRAPHSFDTDDVIVASTGAPIATST